MKRYIDELEDTHYYSPMILKSSQPVVKLLSVFVLACVLVGCGSLKKTTKNSKAKPTVVQSPSSAASEANTELGDNDKNCDISCDKHGDITHSANNESLANGEATTISKTQPVFVHSDIFERIRDGFKLPNLKSKHVRQYEKWNSTHPSYLTDMFKRAEPFLYYIVEEIDKRSMPMEIALLPAVESAFKVNAVSRSRAAGLWQFIPSTGKSFGLRQDWWYDGRRDVLLSTQAALDYLEQLHGMFDGDWFLALAAYNAGQGTVLKAIKANQRKRRKTNFVNLKLRSETQRYVPKLIALRNIVENPAAFNVNLPKIENRDYFDVVNLSGQVDLRKFSDSIELDHDRLKTMNAGFLRWATSPDGPHRLLVPLAYTIAGQQSPIAQNDAALLRYRKHIIEPNETLSGIAKQHGVSVAAITTTNNLRNHFINIGKVLLIPMSEGSAVPVRSRPNVNTNQRSQSGNKHITHIVKRGDTLWSIARNYQVRLQELLTWNNLSTDQILSLNQALKIFTSRTN